VFGVVGEDGGELTPVGPDVSLPRPRATPITTGRNECTDPNGDAPALQGGNHCR
jgi:hypothetical protein